ncbi:MAG: hypothetical protein AUI92_08185 [Thaumarchaeota archaeon 13_1_40CM_3_38_6]|nr:MAG: hypothetical protein AUI92_08185 [Thaumarchaeota archaeon 13_1_40CM_3_38_6]
MIRQFFRQGKRSYYKMNAIRLSRFAIGCFALGLVGIIYAIVDYGYTISTQRDMVCDKLGSNCPFSAGVFEFSNIEKNFSIWLILPISVGSICVGLIRK